MHHLVSSYLDMQDFANVTGETPTAGSSDEAFALLINQAASRLVDLYTRRFFAQEVANKVFDVRRGGQRDFSLPDLAASPTVLKADVDRDGTFERDLISEGITFVLTPEVGPFYYIEFLESPSLARGSRIQIGNLWGWPRQSVAGSTLSGALGASTTSITVANAAPFKVGHTIVIESEMGLITGVSGLVLTVIRGINGSTAVTHLDTTAVIILTYPSSVVMATSVAAARLRKRAATAFADPSLIGVGGFTDLSAMTKLMLGSGFPKEFHIFLSALRRRTIGGVG